MRDLGVDPVQELASAVAAEEFLRQHLQQGLGDLDGSGWAELIQAGIRSGTYLVDSPRLRYFIKLNQERTFSDNPAPRRALRLDLGPTEGPNRPSYDSSRALEAVCLALECKGKRGRGRPVRPVLRQVLDAADYQIWAPEILRASNEALAEVGHRTPTFKAFREALRKGLPETDGMSGPEVSPADWLRWSCVRPHLDVLAYVLLAFAQYRERRRRGGVKRRDVPGILGRLVEAGRKRVSVEDLDRLARDARSDMERLRKAVKNDARRAMRKR